MDRPQTITTQWLGEVAHEVLQTHRTGVVRGDTSRGIFIQPPGKWLLFLSTEPFRGPMTVNLVAGPGSLPRVQIGSAVNLAPERIQLVAAAFEVTLHGARRWRPPPMGAPPPEDGRLDRLANLALRVYQARPASGSGSLLPLVLNSLDRFKGMAVPPDSHGEMQRRALNHIQAGKPSPFEETWGRFLGTGSGLTPAGDDFLLGVALAVNRWPDLWPDGSARAAFNRHLRTAAYQETTTLSANLIECASRGQADERLISALDWIMTGVGREAELAEGLLSWGNDSGLAALAGIGHAIVPT